ncbi:MAG: uroporphyrinogen-III synthase [Pseudomonadota bacterium]
MTQAAPLCLITRPEPEATRFADRVAAELGLETLTSPLMQIEPVAPPEPLAECAGVILTSGHAAGLLGHLGVPQSTPCYAVGAKTAQIAENLGYVARVLGGDADRLVAALIAEPPPGPLLHLRGEHSRGNVAERLTEAGMEATESVVYRQIARGLSLSARQALAGKQTVILPLFSPRSAALACSEMAHADKVHATLHPVALSPAVAAAAQFSGDVPTVIATMPTEDSLIAAIARTAPVRAWVEKAGLQS